MISIITTITFGAGLLLQVGAGCFAPTIVENNGDVVILKYGPWETPHEILGRAELLCDAHNKVAKPVSDEVDDLEPSFRNAIFDCVPAASPST